MADKHAAFEKKQVTIFMTIIFFAIAAFAVLIIFNLLQPLFILGVLCAILILIYTQVGKFFVQLEEYERGVVFRYGKFKTIAGPGWVFLIPFVETCVPIDLRIKTIDVPPQEAVTKDNIKLVVDAIVYMKVTDPAKAVLNVENYEKAVKEYLISHIRDVVGKMEMSQVISNINEINKTLLAGVAKACGEWGLEVTHVEIQDIKLPQAVIESMHKKKAAEQEKLATMERAAGTRMEIEAIRQATSRLSPTTLQYYYMQSLNKIAEGKSTKLIFPLELSKLANAISSKMGVPYSEAQEEVVHKYQELRKEEPKKSPKSIVEELREEMDVEEPLPKGKKIAEPKKPKKIKFTGKALGKPENDEEFEF